MTCCCLQHLCKGLQTIKHAKHFYLQQLLNCYCNLWLQSDLKSITNLYHWFKLQVFAFLRVKLKIKTVKLSIWKSSLLHIFIALLEMVQFKLNIGLANAFCSLKCLRSTFWAFVPLASKAILHLCYITCR